MELKILELHLLFGLNAVSLMPEFTFRTTFKGCYCSAGDLQFALCILCCIVLQRSILMAFEQNGCTSPLVPLYRKKVISSIPVVWWRNARHTGGFFSDKYTKYSKDQSIFTVLLAFLRNLLCHT